MSLSIDQLLDVIELRKGEDDALWASAIAFEEETGDLQHLIGRRATCQRLFDRVTVWLQESTPNLIDANIDLRGALQLQTERGTGTAAKDALDSLAEYEASVISMDAAILNAPDTGGGTGNVV